MCPNRASDTIATVRHQGRWEGGRMNSLIGEVVKGVTPI